MKNLIKKENNDLKEIIHRIKKRDFKGSSGLAVKNSIYQFSTNVTAKIGSLLFTIIIARLLMPELFGLYSLALSTILIFSIFSELGLGTVLTRFASRELAKKRGKIGSYIRYLLKLKIYLAILVPLILILSAKWIATGYYNKPIHLALLAGVLYLIFWSFTNFYLSIFQAYNKFQFFLKKELLFQVVRLILVPIAVILTLSKSTETILLTLFLALAICHLLVLLFLFFNKIPIKKSRALTKKEKKRINKFILPMSITVLSGVVFGYIDMVMLGKFVLAEFIGYYSASLTLVNSAVAIITFSAALLPIFSRLKGKRLYKILKKVLLIILPISLLAVIGTILISSFIINIIYGSSYENSIFLLKLLSPLLVISPLVGIYSIYFISKGDPSLVAKILIFSAVLNIILNYILITWLVQYSFYMAVVGAAIATLISRTIHLSWLAFMARPKKASF